MLAQSILSVATRHDAMMHVRLSRNGRETVYTLTKQSGQVIVGPAFSENSLEVLASKFLAAEQQKKKLISLGKFLTIAVCGLVVSRG